MHYAISENFYIFGLLVTKGFYYTLYEPEKVTIYELHVYIRKYIHNALTLSSFQPRHSGRRASTHRISAGTAVGR